MAVSSLLAPKTAWPTLALAIVAIASLGISLLLLALGVIPAALAMPLATVGLFAVFTPMHDASHRALSRTRWLNELVGHLSAFALLAPFAAFRFVHLEHHRHTNHPGRDPDFYAGGGPVWLLPFRWLTQDLHYYYLIGRQWNDRPTAERLQIVAHFGLVGIVIALFASAGHGATFVLGWLLPTRIALGMLAYAFDYLPHAPHEIPSSEDRYAATRIIEAPGLTTLFLYQNYHLIHHLYPGVPFYRYRKIFDERQDELARRGAHIVRIGVGSAVFLGARADLSKRVHRGGAALIPRRRTTPGSDSRMPPE